MSSLKITIQHALADAYPLRIEYRAAGRLPLWRESQFKLTAQWHETLASHQNQTLAYGTALGKLLFQEGIRDVFMQARQETEENFRVLLIIEAPDLKGWHWERLCAPVGIGGKWHHLAQDQRTLFSLYLPSVTDRRFPLIGRRDLRALVLVANPPANNKFGLARIDSEATVAAIQRSMGEIPTTVLAHTADAAAPPTFDALMNAVSNDAYTLLHIVAHGMYRERDGETLLYLVDDAGEAVTYITASKLLDRLNAIQNRGLPYFTFLCTCDSAVPEAEGALGGLGQRLVQELGMPAVIAMTERISIDTAERIAAPFYHYLREHGLVDRALAQACAQAAEADDILVPAMYGRLGTRPLFSDDLDRPLTEAEITYGLERLGTIIAERAPVLTAEFLTAAQQVQRSLGSDEAALAVGARQEYEQGLATLTNLSNQAVERSFAAVALDQKLPPYDGRCPFLGLVAFHEGDKQFFFGREPLVAQLVAQIEQQNFVAVLGGSGSGKSSLVLAGLVPALQAKNPKLRLAYMTPGHAPVKQLTHLVPLLRQGDTVLVIDQFEEAFTLCHDEAERQRFFALLLGLAQRYQLILTMRADFWGECAPYQPLRDMMQAHQKLIAPMSTTELRSAMDQQAAAVDLQFEGGLSHTILREVTGEPGAMPLLQHTLLELWHRRHGRWLYSKEYEALGGVQKAIAGTADKLYRAANKSDQDLLREIFLRLTRLDETKTTTDHRDTRQRVTLAELVPATMDPTPIKALVQRLASARLVVTGIDATGQETVEVAHEALIRYWPRLRQWLAQDRDLLAQRNEIRVAAQQWQEADANPDLLIHRGSRLEDIEALLRLEKLRLNQQEQTYLTACIQLRDQEAAAQEAQRQQELKQARRLVQEQKRVAQEQQKRAEEQTQAAANLRRRAIYLTVVATIALIATIGAVFFGLESNKEKVKAENAQATAEYNERNAQAQLLASRANELHDSRQVESISVALNAMKTTYDEDKYITGSAYNAWFQWLPEKQSGVLFGHSDVVASAVFNHNSSRILTASSDNTARLWDAQGNPLATLNGHSGSVRSAVFNHDGSRILTASDDKTARLWDAQGNALATLTGHSDWVHSAVFNHNSSHILTVGYYDKTARLWDAQGNLLAILEGHSDRVNSAVFNHDGSRIITASTDSTARLWDAQGNLLAILEGHSGLVNSAVFNHDGSRIITASTDSTARLWDAQGNPLVTLEGHSDIVNSSVFNHDGSRILTVSDDNTARLWDAQGNPLATLEGHSNSVSSAVFNHDGSRILTASWDNTARLWDAQGNPLATLEGHSDRVNSSVFNHDGSRIITASWDNTAHLWDAQGFSPASLTGHSAVFNHDGSHILTASSDNTARLWDAQGNPLATLQGHSNFVRSAVFSHDSSRILTASYDNTARLWDAQGNPLATLQGHSNFVRSAVFSHDSSRILTASWDNTARLWDAQGNPLVTLTGHSNSVSSAVFNHDGSRILTASWDNTARLWDVQGNPLATLEGHSDRVNSAVFNHDGSRIITVSDDNTARLWDAQGNSLAILDGHLDWVVSAVFNHDGSRVLTASRDKTARLWDAQGNPLATLLRHSDLVNSAVFSHDGSRILTGSEDKTARLWDAQGNYLAVLEGHSAPVWSAVFNHDGNRILTASADDTARLWPSYNDVGMMVAEGEAWVCALFSKEVYLDYVPTLVCPEN